MSIYKELMLVVTTAAMTSGIMLSLNVDARDKKKQGSSQTSATKYTQNTDTIPKTDLSIKDKLISKPITLEEANELRNEYEKSNGRKVMVRHKGPSGTGDEKDEVLNGFIFDKNHLLEILTDNHSKLGPEADKVIFYFGKKGSFGFKKHPNLHFIAIGMKKVGEEYVLMTDFNRETTQDQRKITFATASIFDKAESSPPFTVK